jgi:hypothetical protein
MGHIVCTETSVRHYHSTLRKTSKEHTSHLSRGGILKSRIRNASLCLNVKFVKIYQATSWTTENSGLDSRQEFSLVSSVEHSHRIWGPRCFLYNGYRD